MGHRETRGVRAVKTAVTAVLLAAALVGVASAGVGAWSAVRAILIVGLALTVVADWLLAPVDNSRSFMGGLAFFLVGYLLYGIAFLVAVYGGAAGSEAASVGIGGDLTTVGRGGPGGVFLLLVYLPVYLFGFFQYRTLTRVPKELAVPVVAYIVVVSNLFAAGIVYALHSLTAEAVVADALLVLIAVVMIYLSDSLIAHNLFGRPLPSPQLWIMPTYHLGQIAVVLFLIL